MALRRNIRRGHTDNQLTARREDSINFAGLLKLRVMRRKKEVFIHLWFQVDEDRHQAEQNGGERQHQPVTTVLQAIKDRILVHAVEALGEAAVKSAQPYSWLSCASAWKGKNEGSVLDLIALRRATPFPMLSFNSPSESVRVDSVTDLLGRVEQTEE